MKIINTDNLCRDHISDELIATNLTPNWAIKITALLNQHYGGEHSNNFFMDVTDDYVLHEANLP